MKRQQQQQRTDQQQYPREIPPRFQRKMKQQQQQQQQQQAQFQAPSQPLPQQQSLPQRTRIQPKPAPPGDANHTTLSVFVKVETFASPIIAVISVKKVPSDLNHWKHWCEL